MATQSYVSREYYYDPGLSGTALDDGHVTLHAVSGNKTFTYDPGPNQILDVKVVDFFVDHDAAASATVRITVVDPPGGLRFEPRFGVTSTFDDDTGNLELDFIVPPPHDEGDPTSPDYKWGVNDPVPDDEGDYWGETPAYKLRVTVKRKASP